jgi:hypothetical protein
MNSTDKPSYNPAGRSPIGWVGGKRQLAKAIIPLIPPHLVYVEPFAGGAWVLFKKTPSQHEILNDINGDLARLYRVLRFHSEEFCRSFRWMLASREEFERVVAENPETLKTNWPMAQKWRPRTWLSALTSPAGSTCCGWKKTWVWRTSACGQ